MSLTEQDKVDIEQIIGDVLDKFAISPGRVYPSKRFAFSTLFVFLVVVVISLGGVLSINATCGHIRTQLDHMEHHMNDSLDQIDQRIQERGAILQRLDDRTKDLGSTNSGAAMRVTKTIGVSPAD